LRYFDTVWDWKMLSQKVEAATSATRGKSVGRVRVRVGIVAVWVSG
jgi:hypothetical protein